MLKRLALVTTLTIAVLAIMPAPAQARTLYQGTCGPDVFALQVRLYNRTPYTQTFLWWANMGVHVDQGFKSFFPPDAHVVADHAKRALEQKRRRCIENFEIARIEDNPGRVAVSPFDPYRARTAECVHRGNAFIRSGMNGRLVESKRACISALPCAARRRAGSLRR